MKRTLKTLGLLIVTILLTFGLAQQQQQTGQQNQQGQQGQQQGTQGQQGQQGQQFGQNQQLTDTLMELRQIQNRLGQLINDLERQMGFPTTGGLEQRIGGLERTARASALRQARRDLRGLRTDIEAGERREETAREIGQIRADLRRGFAGATGEEQQRANELEQQLGRLEEQVRTGAAEAGRTFQDVLGRFDEELDRNQQQFERQDRQRGIQTARTRLENLRGDLEAGRDRERVAGEIGQIRGELERTFQGAQGEERQRFDELTRELGTLEEQVRTGNEQARQTFEGVMERFERDFNNMNQNQGQGQGN